MSQKTPRASGAVDTVIGARIRIYRQERNLSQVALGQRLGVTFQQVQKYETGSNRVGAARLLEISHHLGVPLVKFFPDEEAVTQPAPDADPDFAPISAFMASAEGFRLCRAFLRLRDGRMRKTILAFVEGLAEW
ncbi:MAG: helix-turn-helix transcriptional regulator [Alphaproteobacteria bacterium]|nr:helix-turn-helix domain-containing protein [Alphaproteobacteria bacterium]MDE2113048.1 helix-turn-helix transcriptional regulator [Alphaproteobacteria bacterium]MDE2493671.1 helix-turn-helix transcriptional regulator [Alphaproteobacteria bacterium]